MRSFKLTAAVMAVAATMAFAPTADAQRSGTYAVEGNGGSTSVAPYTGTVQLQATGPSTWTARWNIAGEITNGVGVQADKFVSFGYVTGGQTGTAVFCVEADGSLVGVWTIGRSNPSSGRERWLPR